MVVPFTNVASVIQISRDKTIRFTDNLLMSTLTLARNFESFAADANELSQQATAIASTAPADKAEIATGIAGIATEMANMADRIAATLRSSSLDSKKAA